MERKDPSSEHDPAVEETVEGASLEPRAEKDSLFGPKEADVQEEQGKIPSEPAEPDEQEAKEGEVKDIIAQELAEAVGPTISARPATPHAPASALISTPRKRVISDDDLDALVGDVLEGRYSIEEQIGEGGMGVVYKARHIELQMTVAIKVLLPELGAIDSVVKRFQREARSASRLDHPGIIRVTDFGRTGDGLLFLVMEYLEGDSLSQIIEEEAPLPADRAVRIAQQLLLSLDHAHNRSDDEGTPLGIVHRDLKPDNIMVMSRDTPQESVKILDFGIVRITEAKTDTEEKLTVEGMVFGTPEYLSPEQASGDPVDKRADLYAVGIIMYEMLTGKRPFTAPNRMALLGKHLNQKPEPLYSLVPRASLPEGLNALVMKALEKNPDDRFQTGLEFYEALLHISGDQRPVTFWPLPAELDKARRKKIGRSRLKTKLMWFLGIVLAAAALAFGVYLFFKPKKEKKETQVEKTEPKSVRTKELDRKLRLIEGHLAAAHPDLAIKDLKLLAEEYKDDARVRMLMGRAYFVKADRINKERGLKAYAEAVALDPSLKKDKYLRQDVKAMLQSKIRKVRKQALEFIDASMGRDGADLLKFISTESKDYKFIGDALVVAQKNGVDDAIDKFRFYTMMLHDSPQCSERLVAVRGLVALKDIRAIKPLRVARWRSYYKRRKQYYHNECIMPALKDAVKKLRGYRDQIEKEKEKDKTHSAPHGGRSSARPAPVRRVRHVARPKPRRHKRKARRFAGRR